MMPPKGQSNEACLIHGYCAKINGKRVSPGEYEAIETPAHKLNWPKRLILEPETTK